MALLLLSGPGDGWADELKRDTESEWEASGRDDPDVRGEG